MFSRDLSFEPLLKLDELKRRFSEDSFVFPRLKVVERLLTLDLVKYDCLLVSDALGQRWDDINKHLVDLVDDKDVYRIAGKTMSPDSKRSLEYVLVACGLSGADPVSEPAPKAGRSWLSLFLYLFWYLSLMGILSRVGSLFFAARTRRPARSVSRGFFNLCMDYLFKAILIVLCLFALLYVFAVGFYVVADHLNESTKPRTITPVDYERMVNESAEHRRKAEEHLKEAKQVLQLIQFTKSNVDKEMKEHAVGLNSFKANLKNEIQDQATLLESRVCESLAHIEGNKTAVLADVAQQVSLVLKDVKETHSNEITDQRALNSKAREAFKIQSGSDLRRTLVEVRDRGVTEVEQVLDTLQDLTAKISSQNHDVSLAVENNSLTLGRIAREQDSIATKHTVLRKDLDKITADTQALMKKVAELQVSCDRFESIRVFIEDPWFVYLSLFIALLACFAIVDICFKMFFNKFLQIHDYEERISAIVARLTYLENHQQKPSRDFSGAFWAFVIFVFALIMVGSLVVYAVLPIYEKFNLSYVATQNVLKVTKESLSNATNVLVSAASEPFNILKQGMDKMAMASGNILQHE
jgi:hypothetical protein